MVDVARQGLPHNRPTTGPNNLIDDIMVDGAMGDGILVARRSIGKAGGVAAGSRPVVRRRFSLGMRTRITVGFSLLGLLVSLGLALLTYTLARSYLIDKRELNARNDAFTNAAKIRGALREDPNNVQAALATVSVQGDTLPLLYANGLWVALDPTHFGVGALPEIVRGPVFRRETGSARYQFDGVPYVGVGVHIEEVHAEYFERSSLADAEKALGIIATSLAVAATTTTLVAAGLGLWAGRRVLKPLSRVADAANELASGGLDTRLEEEADPDLQRLATSFNNMADAVKFRIEREARFASDVSHELRSPITALTAAVEVLDGRRSDLPDRSQQALDVVVSQVRRFDQMVLDLLEISRLDAGASELHLEPVQLDQFVARVAGRYGFSNVPVVCDPVWAGRTAGFDRRRIERVLANLLGNAEHHAGGPVRIAIDSGANGDGIERVRLAVEDAGPGVAAAERERIFERFARGATARHRVGTGLGLALVKEHVSLQGGSTWVEDRKGGGARFVVEIPSGHL